MSDRTMASNLPLPPRDCPICGENPELRHLWFCRHRFMRCPNVDCPGPCSVCMDDAPGLDLRGNEAHLIGLELSKYFDSDGLLMSECTNRFCICGKCRTETIMMGEGEPPIVEVQYPVLHDRAPLSPADADRTLRRVEFLHAVAPLVEAINTLGRKVERLERELNRVTRQNQRELGRIHSVVRVPQFGSDPVEVRPSSHQ